MLKTIRVPFRIVLFRASLIILFVAVFIASVLLLNRDAPSWELFFQAFVPTLAYSIACGLLVCLVLYFGEGWFSAYGGVVRTACVVALCAMCGLAGNVIGTTVLHLTRSPYPSLPLPPGSSLVEVISAAAVFAPIMALISAFFGLIVFGYDTLLAHIERTAAELKDREVREERLLKLKAEAELRALQARINPHFLFNTLNTIASLIAEEPRIAEEMTEKLSALFRYTLSADRESRVKLSQELHILQSYLDIEQVRLGSRIRASLEVDAGLDGVRVPPLLLQPLVENSVKYAVSSREEGGSIQVRIKRTERTCVMEVVDDGPGFTGQTAGAGYALDNIRQRLRAMFGEEQSFSITRADRKTTVRIEIPIQSEGAIAGSEAETGRLLDASGG